MLKNIQLLRRLIKRDLGEGKYVLALFLMFSLTIYVILGLTMPTLFIFSYVDELTSGGYPEFVGILGFFSGIALVVTNVFFWIWIFLEFVVVSAPL